MVLIRLVMILMRQMTTTPALAEMLRAIRSIASNSNGPVPIHAILGSEKTARKLAKHARSFFVNAINSKKKEK